MPRWLLLAPMPVMTAWTIAPLARASFSRSMTISPRPRREPSRLFRIEGAGGLVSGLSCRIARKVPPGRRIPEMCRFELLLTSTDDSCIDDAASDHLDGAVKCDHEVAQAADTAWLGPMNPYLLQTKPAAAQLSLPRSVVSSGTDVRTSFSRSDGALLIRRQMNDLLTAARRS